MKELTYEQALHRATSLCSSGEHSSNEIRSKLLKWGVSLSEANDAINYLISEKYIDNNPRTVSLYSFLPQLFKYFQNLMVAHFAKDKSDRGIAGRWAAIR